MPGRGFSKITRADRLPHPSSVATTLASNDHSRHPWTCGTDGALGRHPGKPSAHPAALGQWDGTGLAWLPGLGTGQGTSCSSSALGTPTGIWAAYRGAPPLAPKRCTVRCPLG